MTAAAPLVDRVAVICPWCEGSGDRSHPSDPGEFGGLLCSLCEGSGAIRRGTVAGRPVICDERGRPAMFIGEEDLAA